MTLVDADKIDYEATIEDPKVFTRPWKLAVGWKRAKDRPFQEILEQACHEGNLDLAHMRGVKR
jgi:hypothetical protein